MWRDHWSGSQGLLGQRRSAEALDFGLWLPTTLATALEVWNGIGDFEERWHDLYELIVSALTSPTIQEYYTFYGKSHQYRLKLSESGLPASLNCLFSLSERAEPAKSPGANEPVYLLGLSRSSTLHSLVQVTTVRAHLPSIIEFQ
ncbi:hypothetical protein AG1IA_08780 [Rhizoctonia solani AG-1 IA]|uniref:Uncharacterized protein n=1 Tax=Thanatephorus cucumeris (strain AG1-IA) TaxID=983506 RepID=L8WKB2_THACA|nr:hypothetical protein AG1IA_08780 [Rhizoctonia solani AG-1 IA]